MRNRVAGAGIVTAVCTVLILVLASLASSDEGAVFEGPVARADCGPGSLPELGLQGRVPKEDRLSGRSQKGYRCNLELMGQYQGEGSSWVSPSYGHCAYMSTRFPSDAKRPGVQVVDVSDPTNPKLTDTLTNPGVIGTWESLKVNKERGLLAGTLAPIEGAGFFAIYDIKTDCRHPRLLGQLGPRDLPKGIVFGHEGDFAPDGQTYWATMGLFPGVSAIDVSDPTKPEFIFTGTSERLNHGFSISADNKRLYLAELSGAHTVFVESITGKLPAARTLDNPNGFAIYDISDITERRPNPQMHLVGRVGWRDGIVGQHGISINYSGHPYVLWVDEGGQGGVRIVDIADEKRPRVVSKLRLEIMTDAHEKERREDVPGNGFPFSYESHYCAVDRTDNPTAAACSYFNAGVRVFDIRTPTRPREIAYFNPPAQVGKRAELRSSEHAQGYATSVGGTTDMTADWCTSPPRFVRDELWVTCTDNGFLALRFTNGAYPLTRKACTSRRSLTYTLPRGATKVRVTDGKTRRRFTRKGRAVTVDFRGNPAGTQRVVLTATVRGRAYRRVSTPRLCARRR